MKHKLSLLFVMALFGVIMPLHAAYLRDIPMQLIQPNGDTLRCYASGDEYFNYLHDLEGYTIIKHPITGYYVYAQKVNDDLVATRYVAGKVSPTSVGLSKRVLISAKAWGDKRNKMMSYKRTEAKSEAPNLLSKSKAHQTTQEANHGTLNNIVIFIRFSDEQGYSTSFQTINNNFNDSSSQNAVSLYNYFKTTSYGALRVLSSFYPAQSGSSVISYQDTVPRSYYRPYNAATNVNGYTTEDERTAREHALLRRAVNYASPLIPNTIDLDYDSDGNVDNICFVVQGSPDGWSSLLWPHRWALYSLNVQLHNKRVYDYNFTLETQLNTSVLCHEMQHTLSFPDLYHYDDAYSDRVPVGYWDLMEYNQTPPQMSLAFLKWRYGNWLPMPTAIMDPGKYTIVANGSDTVGTHSYFILTEETNQYIIVEYRNKANSFDSSIPNSGVLFYRANTMFSGNTQYDGQSSFDEIYIFRPGANTDTINGDLNDAGFGNGQRTSFDANSNPRPFLTDGTFISDIKIRAITYSGNQASFIVEGSADDPTNFTIDSVGSESVSLSWTLNRQRDVVLFVSESPITDLLEDGQNYTLGTVLPSGLKVVYAGSDSTFTHTQLNIGKTYYYLLSTKCSATPTWSFGTTLEATTTCGSIKLLPYKEDFEATDAIPSCYIQQNVVGSKSWSISKGITAGNQANLASAYSGTNNLLISNMSYSADKTKLILPEFNFSSVLNKGAFLSFAHAQPAWNTDQDELYIYYRTSSTSNWVLLDSFKTSLTSWTLDTIELPNLSSTYQIAFEAVVKYGYGIVLDDIEVNIAPCEIEAMAEPSNGGVTTGSQKVAFGSTVTLSATANSGYTFSQWSDGNTDNPRQIDALSDSIIYALFVKQPSIQFVSSASSICQYDSLVVRVENVDSLMWYVDGSEVLTNRNECSLPMNMAQTINVQVRGVNVDTLLGSAVSSDTLISRAIQVNPIYDMPIVEDYITQGATYQRDGWNIQTTDSLVGVYNYVRYLNSRYGCDSVVHLQLSVLDTYLTYLSDTICQGELPYTWNGVVFTQAGTKTKQLQSTLHIDSLVIMTLEVLPTYQVSESRSICLNQLPYTWNNYQFNNLSAGQHSVAVTLSTVAGCDSIVTMLLDVKGPSLTQLYDTICDMELPYLWDGKIFNQPQILVDTLVNSEGCDSIIYHNLTVQLSYKMDLYETSFEPYDWHGKTYTESGVYVDSLNSVAGCDSILTLHLTMTTDSGTMVPQSVDHSAFILYPNPATNQFVIESEANLIGKQFVITNTSGVEKMHMMITKQPLVVSIEDLADGVYLVFIDNVVLKLIKQ